MEDKRHISGLRWTAWLMPMPALALAVMLLASPARAQDADAATKLKAAYLLNFMKATSWPTGSFTTEQTPVQVIVIGDGDFAEVFSTLTAQQVIGTRVIRVRRVPGPFNDRTAFIEAIKDAHVLYLASSAGSQAAAVLQAVAGRPLLVVGDVPEFAYRGGMIGLDIDDRRIVFDANVVVMRRAKMEVSSKVLRLARRVYREGS